jgi:DNA-binding HxlR family transcriptional regulator
MQCIRRNIRYPGGMLKRDYPSQYCSMASALEIVGERWTILIVRDIFLGVRRFDDLQRSLGVARNILQTRLERLVDSGILVKKPYQERPVRYEYRLTVKGADLWPILVALLQWGDRYAIDGERPIILEHRGCGGELDDRRRCTTCGADVTVTEAIAIRTGAKRVADDDADAAGAAVDADGAEVTVRA